MNGTRRCRIEFGSAHEVPGEVVFAAQGYSAVANLGDFANLCEHHLEIGYRCLDGEKSALSEFKEVALDVACFLSWRRWCRFVQTS